MTDIRALVVRIEWYLAWQESPEYEPCERCKGKGYHHGFGEHGHDPDWCSKCGGGEQPTEPGTWDADAMLREAADALRAAGGPEPGRGAWQPIETAPKSRKVMVFYRNALGNARTTFAFYAERFQEPAEDGGELNPADEEYYLPEGWYEWTDSDCEYSHSLGSEPTHWQPLPDPPAPPADATRTTE